jgi:sugar lactone lactonase YvrE
MITIGYSTRSPKPELQEYFKKTCGVKNVQVIEKVNPNGQSLTDVYNDILNESENDIVVLCHDDIYFDNKSWGFKILEHFKKTDYGILGVAGSTNITKIRYVVGRPSQNGWYCKSRT